MSRDDKKRKRESRERTYRALQAKFEELHRKGIYFKRLLRTRGIALPFYDFYDSYFKEFEKIASQAKQHSSSLLGVFEVEDAEYYGSDRSRFASGMHQIFWHSGIEHTGYGTCMDDSNVNGYTNAFWTEDGQVKTLIVIRKSVPKSKPHREYKYVFKLAALLHELGHVHDMEHEVNFDHSEKTVNVSEAEVYAHLYSLRRMAEQNYYQCFNMLVDALTKAVSGTDYLGEVARLTLGRMPEYKLTDVTSISLEPLTAADLEILGFDGRRALRME